MDELDVVKALFKLLFWIVRGVLRLLGFLFFGLFRMRPTPARPTQKKAPPRPKALPASNADLVAQLDGLVARAKLLSARALERRDTERFASTTDAQLERLAAFRHELRGATKRPLLERTLHREASIARLVELVLEQRRGARAELLGDTDALATASYAPIVELCTQRGIPLSSDRAATIIDGDKLFFLSVDDPSGLAAIVLPSSFATDLRTWPAIAHEIGHDFFNSVADLPSELRKVLKLQGDVRVVQLGTNRHANALEVLRIPERATAAWLEELFADAFGTMMLGPAYVATMAASFASPAEPGHAVAMMPDGPAASRRYEEHPPGHVRVVAACRLLARMGYGKEADEREAAWRRLHGNPEYLYAPSSDDRWITIEEAPVLAYAEEVGRTLYMTGLPCLRGLPLRFIAGLDFGPRQHEEARRFAARLAAGQPIVTSDARLLVAGAVLASFASPAARDRIYAAAREAIVGVDSLRRRTSPTIEEGIAITPRTIVEALIVGELMQPPVSRRRS